MQFPVMFKTVYLLTCFCALSEEASFKNKVITTIRHGIEKNLEYIDNNYDKVNVDCLFGVVLSTAVLKDAYQNGTHVMDNSSLKLINKSIGVLKRSVPVVQKEKIWIAKYILDYDLWKRNIKYKYNKLDEFARTPDLRILENIIVQQNFSSEYPSTDFCLQDIVNLTIKLNPNKCYINDDCWNKYYVYNKEASGYILTHRLLLLQLAKARKCVMDHVEYAARTKQICSLIFAEIFNGDYFDVLDEMFDLFLEEIVLCGYEGYTDFLTNKWLMYILKTQRQTGCFPAILRDKLKTRMKRNTNILEDGCSDHTTGLGVAVLALHYNYIIKENVVNLY